MGLADAKCPGPRPPPRQFIPAGAQNFQPGSSGERESRHYRLSCGMEAARLLCSFALGRESALRAFSISSFGPIVQPTGALKVRPGKDSSDLFWNLGLMISHIHATIGSEVKDLDLSCVMGHDVFECFLDPAETLVDAAGNLNSAAQRNLKMRCAFHRPTLKEIIGADTHLVTLGEGRRQGLGIIIDFREKHGLVEELYAPCAQAANVALCVDGDFTDVVEMCDDHCGFTRFMDTLEQSRQSGILEPLRLIGDHFCAESN